MEAKERNLQHNYVLSNRTPEFPQTEIDFQPLKNLNEEKRVPFREFKEWHRCRVRFRMRCFFTCIAISHNTISQKFI